MEKYAERKEQQGERQLHPASRRLFTPHWCLATFILN